LVSQTERRDCRKRNQETENELGKKRWTFTMLLAQSRIGKGSEPHTRRKRTISQNSSLSRPEVRRVKKARVKGKRRGVWHKSKGRTKGKKREGEKKDPPLSSRTRPSLGRGEGGGETGHCPVREGRCKKKNDLRDLVDPEIVP